METIELLKALTQAPGVSGEEDTVLSVAADLVKDLGETSISTLKSLICKVKVADPSKPHIMLNAHIDEIGMIVTGIDSKGFVKIARVGGIDHVHPCHRSHRGRRILRRCRLCAAPSAEG